MFSAEGPKELRDRGVLVGELVNHILKVFLAMPPSEKFFPFPRTEESGIRDSKFFIGHDFVLPCSLPWGEWELYLGPRRKGKIMRVSLIVALALLMTATVTTAQHQHDPIQVKQINGREQPEQIPDEIAYSNFFFGHSAVPGQVLTFEQRGALDSAFAVMHLSGADELQLRLAAANFREKFEILNKSYTVRAEKGH